MNWSASMLLAVIALIFTCAKFIRASWTPLVGVAVILLSIAVMIKK
jgi:hypothetical protein